MAASGGGLGGRGCRVADGHLGSHVDQLGDDLDACMHARHSMLGMLFQHSCFQTTDNKFCRYKTEGAISLRQKQHPWATILPDIRDADQKFSAAGGE